MIELGYLGRALKLSPAAFGELFHDHCTVGRMEDVVEWKKETDAVTGRERVYPIRKRQRVDVPLYWYTDAKDGQRYFCTYSGYGPSILAELKKRGLEVRVRELVDDGLGKPVVDAVQDVQWRRRQGQVVANILAHRRGRIVCPTAFGKCLGRDTPVMLHNGRIKLVQDIEVGDCLMGPDGQPRRVLSLARGREQMYRVTPTRGDSYVVNESHILSLAVTGSNRVRAADGRQFSPGEVANVSVRDYLASTETFRRAVKGWRVAVQEFGGSRPDLTVSPYVLGLWLGAGRTVRSEFAAPNLKVARVWLDCMKSLGQACKQLGRFVRPTSTSVLDLQLEELQVLGNKHVPYQYRTGLVADRKALLAGLIDSAGHLENPTTVELTAPQPLAGDIAFVARSIGLAAHVWELREVRAAGRSPEVHYRVAINGDLTDLPMRNEDVRPRPYDRRKDWLKTGLKVEPLGEDDYYGFTIDQDRLFLLGDFTVTHNTFIARQLAKIYPQAEIVLTVPFKDVACEIYRDLRREMRRDQVGMVGGGRNSPRRLTVAVSKSLHKCSPDVNLVLADECHALLTESYIQAFNRFHRARLIGLTASPTGRSDQADEFGEAVFGPILCDVSYQDGVAGGNIVPITVRMVNVPDGPDVSGRKDQVYVERVGLWLNDRRNRVIQESVRAVENELGPEAQILIMVDKTEHAYALGQYLPEYTVVTGEPTPERVKQMRRRGAMSKQQEPCTDKQREQYKQEFEDLRLKRVIATKIWRQGVNFRDLACLVRADGKASAIDSVQVPGRLSRLGKTTNKESGLLIDFMDSFSPNLANRSRKRLQVYRKNGWTVEQV